MNIVLSGESGTGKEVLARALHDLSLREGNFVPVNCGALPASLIESELFGHCKGAFSGAVHDRPGHIRSANNGTLLLDEIADLPLAAQPALLRVLQEREVVPIGDSEPTAIDVRVISASHRNLPELVEQKLFRADLYARLSGVSFSVPALRERSEDIGCLVATLLRRRTVDRAASVSFSPAGGAGARHLRLAAQRPRAGQRAGPRPRRV